MKKILIILLLLMCNIAQADVVTFYCRSDTHTINGLNAYKLSETASASEIYDADNQLNGSTAYWWFTIIIRHADSSETTIASLVAETVRSSVGFGVQSATWNCPETNIVSTDALKIIITEYKSAGVAHEMVFVSEQLGWDKLNAATWTCYRYTYWQFVDFQTIPVRTYWGNSDDTYISGIDYTGFSGGYAVIF